MNEIESRVFELYKQEMESRRNSDYEIDKTQMQKLTRAYEFFAEIAERDGGVVDPLKLEPKAVSGGITAYFTVFYLSGDDMARFSEIVGDMSAISLDSTIDGDVCVSFNIPGVFKKIPK